ncbi:MAG: hypothetical protein UY70_C0016G0024 [Candidatus Kaiserbacteria bacterium GW2011_GWB1_52_6]|uniref:Uncharacterized protein n=1 Tax=Candidatus Kaiserbacteria bacterium GW2011_GWB1_52_6 TaxID=1618674 RepID=A0A0G1X944_9BACT|nr:MAG: hypothetical protein UY70_C0016G0024 [Candidatus Kaiserbacteria bacterium GW2011_GWB1_52_6]
MSHRRKLGPGLLFQDQNEVPSDLSHVLDEQFCTVQTVHLAPYRRFEKMTVFRKTDRRNVFLLQVITEDYLISKRVRTQKVIVDPLMKLWF